MERPIPVTAATSAEDAARRASPSPGDPGYKQERRRNSRRRSLKTAQIIFNNGNCTMTCHILDMSEGGALLMVGDILLCPDTFVLKPHVGAERTCEVVWRKGTRIGTRYV